MKRNRSPSTSASASCKETERKNGKRFKRFLTKCKKNSKLMDFTVCCGDREWKVHRLVVGAHSDFFNAACNGDFMEGSSQKVTLEDDPEIVDCMIGFFYTLDYLDGPDIDDEISKKYSNEEDEENPSEMPLTKSAHVYIMADKYGVHGLRDVARSKLIDRLESSYWQYKDFTSMLVLLWTSMPASETRLRRACLNTFFEVRDAILKKNEAVIADLLSIPAFLLDVIRADGAALEDA